MYKLCPVKYVILDSRLVIRDFAQFFISHTLHFQFHTNVASPMFAGCPLSLRVIFSRQLARRIRDRFIPGTRMRRGLRMIQPNSGRDIGRRNHEMGEVCNAQCRASRFDMIGISTTRLSRTVVPVADFAANRSGKSSTFTPRTTRLH